MVRKIRDCDSLKKQNRLLLQKIDRHQTLSRAQINSRVKIKYLQNKVRVMKEKERSLTGRLAEQSQPRVPPPLPQTQQQQQIIKQLLTTSNYYKRMY